MGGGLAEDFPGQMTFELKLKVEWEGSKAGEISPGGTVWAKAGVQKELGKLEKLGKARVLEGRRGG